MSKTFEQIFHKGSMSIYEKALKLLCPLTSFFFFFNLEAYIIVGLYSFLIYAYNDLEMHVGTALALHKFSKIVFYFFISSNIF